MFWQIASFPKCSHHVFLSHSQEDRATLVRPVYDRLTATGVLPWLDQEDYYYGRDSRTALRDGLLRSRHVVFFVTPAMLSNARGWCVFELPFAELVELNFQNTGGRSANYFLPLFLTNQEDARLPRSVWQAVRDRGAFHDAAADGDPVDWCVREVRQFLYREQGLSQDVRNLADRQPEYAVKLRAIPGLLDRVARFHPRRLPKP